MIAPSTSGQEQRRTGRRNARRTDRADRHLEVTVHEPRMTITGHLAAVPKLRISKQGHSVADFRVAHTPG